MTIPVTGDRPIKYSISGLPEGLILDENTGRITGTIESAQKKTYRLVLRASNDFGRDKKKFKIIVDDNICLTPPLGWNSWNAWGVKSFR